LARIKQKSSKHKIDLDVAKKFLRLLAPQGTSFTFQIFADGKSASITPCILHGTLDTLADELTRLNEQGAAISVTINQTDLKGRKKENIIAVRAAFVDLDDNVDIEVLRSCELQPHIVVESSPGRYHAYWLTTNIGLDKFSNIQLGHEFWQAWNANKNKVRTILRASGMYITKRDGEQAGIRSRKVFG